LPSQTLLRVDSAPCLEFDPADDRHVHLVKISETAHRLVEGSDPQRRHEAQLAPVEDLVAQASELARQICERA
jgi:hypothetical protein